MDTWEELEDKTLWDITVNEGVGTLLLVGVACLFLALMYTLVNIEVKIRLGLRRITWKKLRRVH